MDVRAAVNSLWPDWRNHPEESRFSATKRSYRIIRTRYPHLSSAWAVVIANETSAVLRAWDRSLRRAMREDSERFERMRLSGPRRRGLKASLHSSLISFRAGHLRLTLHAQRHVEIELLRVCNPLFARYGQESAWNFGLTVTPNRLLFHFRIPVARLNPTGVIGVDLNFENAVLAGTDGRVEAADLTSILRIQDQMARKRASIQRHISKDLRHQRAVLRRHPKRERYRVDAQLHRITNHLQGRIGERIVVVEDLRGIGESALARAHRSPRGRRRLANWTHGRMVYMLAYKLRTPMVRVNPEGTSQECPRCGGHTALPREDGTMRRGPNVPRRMSRRTICDDCGSEWHRDVAAAIVVLTRGCSILRGAPVPPSARNALLEAAGWRPGDESLRGLIPEPMNRDDAKLESPAARADFRADW